MLWLSVIPARAAPNAQGLLKLAFRAPVGFSAQLMGRVLCLLRLSSLGLMWLRDEPQPCCGRLPCPPHPGKVFGTSDHRQPDSRG